MRRFLRFLPVAIITFLAGSILAFLLSGPFLTTLPRPPKEVDLNPFCVYTEEKDIAMVYLAVLRSEFKNKKPSIVDRASMGGFMESLNNSDGSLKISDETLSDYHARSQTNLLLRNYIPEDQYILVDETEPGKVSRTGKKGTQHPIQKYSEGELSFSTIGFNRDHTEAMLAYSYSCGMLCGHGSEVILRKVDCHWIVRSSDQLWIS